MKRSAICGSTLSVGFLPLFLIALAGCNKSAGVHAGGNGPINDITFSPNGKFIALSYSKTGSCFIYKVALDTDSAIRLTRVKILRVRDSSETTHQLRSRISINTSPRPPRSSTQFQLAAV